MGELKKISLEDFDLDAKFTIDESIQELEGGTAPTTEYYTKYTCSGTTTDIKCC